MTQLVYILEDEAEMVRIMRRALEPLGLHVRDFRRFRDFAQAVGQTQPHLCLIDLGLPDGDGLTVISDLLRGRDVPAIIVSGRSDLTDRVVGLELGADDYIVKPFEPRELAARVRAVLRRGPRQAETPAKSGNRQIAEFNGWIADFSACTLTDPDGNAQNLSSAETSLLHVFLASSGRVLNRSQLLDVGNPDDMEPFDRSIDARVSRLRRKLMDDPKTPKMIRTVYGSGYVFVANVQWDG